MSVPAAFLGIILIWSTTPLAIQWSSGGVGYLFGLSARMALAALFCLLLIVLLRIPFRWHTAARRTYLASSLGLYGAMMAVYWGAQFIPSGLIAVIYGLLPLVTTLVSTLVMGESLWQPGKWVGMVISLAGLLIIFKPDSPMDHATMVGVGAVFISTVLHALSMVWVKRQGSQEHPLAVTTGGLLVALPLYLLTWFMIDGHWPTALNYQNMGAILYLAVIGSVVGFVLFYYALSRLPADAIALTTLITPVCALLIGYGFNHERLEPALLMGSMLILFGLIVHQWGNQLWQRVNIKR